MTVIVDSYNFTLGATADAAAAADADADGLKKKITVNFEGTGTGAGANDLGYGVLRDVISIELVQASVPLIAGAEPDLYIIMSLNGYNRLHSNNNTTKKGFCTIPLQNPLLDTYYTMRRTGSTPDDNYIYYFPEPTRLNKLDIEFLSARNRNVVFANVNYTLTFEIRMLNRTPKPDARFQNGVQGPW
jgi:hypothetical protein